MRSRGQSERIGGYYESWDHHYSHMLPPTPPNGREKPCSAGPSSSGLLVTYPAPGEAEAGGNTSDDDSTKCDLGKEPGTWAAKVSACLTAHSRGSAQTQTGTEIEKENQDRAVAGDRPGHCGAPDTGPGPPRPGHSPVTVSVETSAGEHQSETARSFSDRRVENGRRTVPQRGHVSDDTWCELSRDTCRVRPTSCGDSVTVICRGSDSREKSGNMTSDKAAVSGKETDGGVGGFKRNSFLRRSDSYRRAKNVLSPDLSKHNRKSVEVVTGLNNNSSVISRNDPTHLSLKTPRDSSGENESPDAVASPPGSQKPLPAQNGHHQPASARTEKQGTKGNFFRSLRSSLSFSSLRVKKSQPRPAIHISSPLEASRVSNDYQLPRSNSFVSDHSRTKSPPGPCLTSTPVTEEPGSSEAREAGRLGTPDSDTRARRVKTTTLELGPQDSNWTSPKTKKTNKGPPPKPPVRFRTTALRNQHQRWSFAELSGQPHGHGGLGTHGHGVFVPGYPHHAPPHTCGYQGPGSNGSGQYPPQYHHHHPHHQYHPLPPVYPQYHPACCSYYSYFHPQPPRHLQRSSIASLQGLRQDSAGSRHHAPPAPQILSKFETTLEGGYGYSVGSTGGESGVTGLSRSVTEQGCDCPMCYHSVHNPCDRCGCPSRGQEAGEKEGADLKTRHMSSGQGSTSDYSSLSPDLTSQSSNSRDDNLNLNSTTESSPSPDKEEAEVEEEQEETETSKQSEENETEDSDSACDTNVRVKTREEADYKEDTWIRESRDKFRNNSRRHSWAGGKLAAVGIPKQTSLQDFKKLLAQKTPSQVPPSQKTSAVEQLKSGKTDSAEPFHSSQIVGGSFRKKVSPRRDHRFAAIEEENEAAREEARLQEPEP